MADEHDDDRPNAAMTGASVATGITSVRGGRRWREGSVLVIACGAIVREIQAIVTVNGLADIAIRAVPASYHNRPERIAPAVARLIKVARPHFKRIFVAYGDCGTAGELDQLLGREMIERLPGAHCYAFYSGVDAFEARGDADMRTFYLTDFLAQHFDRLVWQGLGLERHPELRNAYFGNYERVVYLSQAPTPELTAAAERAAARLSLAYDHRPVGYGDLATAMKRLSSFLPTQGV